MGTFHDTNDPLHGITVAAHVGNTVYVGRCHERSESEVVLLDADLYEEDPKGLSRDEYLAKAARFGVWKKHDRLVLSAPEITDLQPLSSYYRRPGSDSTPEIAAVQNESPAPAEAPAAEATIAAPVALETVAPVSTDSAVNLTPEAKREVQRLIAAGENEGPGLRLAVAGGGCSGLVYKIEFSDPRDGDLVVEEEGFEVFLDRKSSIYLRDVTLDYQGGVGGKGFQFRNPNASNTCGCGESFAV